MRGICLPNTSNSPQAFLRSDKLRWSRCCRRTPQMRTMCQKSRARLTWHRLPTWLISIFPRTPRTENVTETSFTCYKTNNSKWETEKKKILRLFVINLAQRNYAFLCVPERHRLETIQGSFFHFLSSKVFGFLRCAGGQGGALTCGYLLSIWLLRHWQGLCAALRLKSRKVIRFLPSNPTARLFVL